MTKQSYWTNRSVLSFAQDKDPIAVTTAKARKLILSFIEAGHDGPPFDVMELAEFAGANVVPTVEVRDAKLTNTGGKAQIEFNPNRPKTRIRYSISHELIHTLFPDWKEEIRYRASHNEIGQDGWQLEMLCNIGAAELLMPIGTFPELQEQQLSIDRLLELRTLYGVSVEALLLRFIKLTESQCAIFSASRMETSGRYKIDYSVSSASFRLAITNGLTVPQNSIISECTAIGFTSKGQERWVPGLDSVNIECVGIAPYPYQTYPRVMGLLSPSKQKTTQSNRPLMLKGDATKPRGSGRRILAFIVNDKTPRWGGGFALSVKRKWNAVQDSFVKWTETHSAEFALGHIHTSPINQELTAAALIAQHGYGDSPKPRIRYWALAECLQQLANVAEQQGAAVHMPRIGSGEARGRWPIVLEMIEEFLTKRGIPVTIYDLPHTQQKTDLQPLLTFSHDSLS